MTKEEILAMEAGSKLDALIAEWKDGCYHDWKGESRVGRISLRCTKCRAFRESGRQLPNQYYSTDTLAAWQVVDSLKELGWTVSVTDFPEDLLTVTGGAEVELWSAEDLGPYSNEPEHIIKWVMRPDPRIEASAKTIPEAICKAALLARLEVRR